MSLNELRLGPVNSERDKAIAFRELQNRLNDTIQTVNKLGGSGVAVLGVDGLVLAEELGTGVPTEATFLRGDRVWAAPVGLGGGTGSGSGSVASFNDRIGHVVPLAADYPPAFIGAADLVHSHNQADIIGLVAQLAAMNATIGGKENTANRGTANGYAELDAGALVPVGELGTGVPDNTKFLRGDQVWAVPSGGGGGGATYQEWWWDKPPAAPSAIDDEFNAALSGWTVVGAGSAAPTNTVAGGKLDMSVPGTGAAFNAGGIERVLPAGAFSLITRVTQLGSSTYSIGGIHVRNATTNKMLRWILFKNTVGYLDTYVGIHRYDSFTNRTAVVNEAVVNQIELFLRITYDGVNISFDFSHNGVTWIRHYTETIATQFGVSLPDRVGLSIDPFNAGTAGRMAFDFFRYYNAANQNTGGFRSISP
jgi:hypothetical protein